jgi:CopG family nickel-responsive transcriptional regulator
MERVTISLDEDLLEAFDAFNRRRGYENRSEAIRDLLRLRLEEDRVERDAAPYGIGCLSYVYNHHQRELARRLTQSQHAHHDLMMSTLHVHLDHENCLEVVLVRGETGAVRRFSEATIAETGVRHGHLHLISADLDQSHHHHHHHDGTPHDHHHDAAAPDGASHAHVTPKT